MCFWTGNIDAQADVAVIGDRLQDEFGIESQPLTGEIARLIAQLRDAERVARIRSGF